MQFSDWIGIVGIAVAIIGIVVGAIGAKCLSVANKITIKLEKQKTAPFNKHRT